MRNSGTASSAALAAITAALASRWRPITAGTARFRMPAFSAAIFSSVSPRKLVWS